MMMCFNQSILQLYETYKNLQEKAQTNDSVIDDTISILKYNSLAGSSYIKLPKELDHPRKGLINIQIVYDNKGFK